MADLKTQPSQASVAEFIARIEDPQRKRECQTLLELMERATGETPTMWGESMVGFGRYHYSYASGREGDWFLTGFASRKREITIYIMPGFQAYKKLMEKIGKARTSVSCLYVKKLDQIDLEVLEELVGRSAKDIAEMYP